MTRMERLSFLIAVYAKSLFAHKQLMACALLSGLCCLAVLLGSAIVFSPNNQYQHFSSELYCQWAFDEPIDYALIADQLAGDAGQISEIHVIAKARSKNGPVIVYGLSDNVFMTKNEIMYGGADAGPNSIQCYIDQSVIPYEYDVNMEELIVKINGVDFNSVGKSFLVPYNFPPSVISQIGYDTALSVSCKQNSDMRVYGDKGIHKESVNEQLESSVGAVYVPLEFMADKHIRLGAMAITMKETLTESARIEFENKYQALDMQTFPHPTLSNWSRSVHEALAETAREMWAVEIVLFACMINQLVFWEILMRRLKPVIKRCRMIGGSGGMLKSSLAAFMTLLAILVVCLAAPIYVLGPQIGLSMLGAVSASVIWVVGLVVYCLTIVKDRKAKGRR